RGELIELIIEAPLHETLLGVGSRAGSFDGRIEEGLGELLEAQIRARTIFRRGREHGDQAKPVLDLSAQNLGGVRRVPTDLEPSVFTSHFSLDELEDSLERLPIHSTKVTPSSVSGERVVFSPEKERGPRR